MQVPLLLSELPREAPGAVGSVAGGDHARGRTPPAGGARGTKAAPAVLPLPRALLGDLSRVAARTITAFIRATVGERDLSVGIVASIQTHGSLANWHPHLHLLVTDGGFRADGTFVPLPLHDVTTLTEAFRRAVLRLFVRRDLLDGETAHTMLAWPHSGFHV